MYLKIKILLILLVIGLPLSGQSFTYSYIDPCTKEVKFINADMSAPIMISYYGQVQTFKYEQLYNGEFDNWMSNTYNQYKSTSPCQGAVATTTTTNVSNQVSNIISNVTNLINLDFSGIGGASVNVGGTTSIGTNVKTNNKKDDNTNTNNSSNSSDANGSLPPDKTGQTGQNGGNPPENQGGNGSSGQGGGGVNGNNSSNNNNGSSGNSSNSGSGDNNSGVSPKEETPKEKSDQQAEVSNSQNTGSAKAAAKARTEVQKPAILVTGDIVGIQTKSDGAKDARGTMSFTRVKGDGTASLGLSADYMVNAKIGNITAVRSWIGINQKGNKHINVASGGVSFLPRSFTSTAMFVRVNSIKSFTAIYGAAGTYGSLYEEKIISTMVIGGFMYKGNLTKSLYATIIAAGVYQPYQKFYTESLFKSKPVVIPFLNLNYKLTKTFGIGLTAGGTYITNQDVLNYQILMGAKLLL
mgnify:FL=1